MWGARARQVLEIFTKSCFLTKLTVYLALGKGNAVGCGGTHL
jgi:hypothetical protein